MVLLLAPFLGCGGSPTTPPRAPAQEQSSEVTAETAVEPTTVEPTAVEPTTAEASIDGPRVAEPSGDVRGDETQATVTNPAPSSVTAPWPSRFTHGGACTVETRPIGRASTRRLPLGLVVSPADGVAVYRSAPDQLTSQRLDAMGLPLGAPRTVEVPSLHHISFVVSTAEGTDVFGVSDACGHRGSGCVITVPLDASGQLRAEPLVQVVQGGQWLELKHHTQVDGTTFAEVHQRWGNHVVRFDRNEAGQLVMERAGPSAGRPGGDSGLGWLFTIEGEAVGMCHDNALLLDPPDGRALYRGENVVPIRGLPLHSTLSAFPLEAGIGLVFRRGVPDEDEMSIEPRGRPRFAHLGLDGRLIGPVTDASLETLPADVGDRMHVSVLASGGGLTMVRQDALLHSVGRPISLGSAPPPRRWSPQMSFNGAAFIVLHATKEGREWVLHTSTVQCGESDGSEV